MSGRTLKIDIVGDSSGAEKALKKTTDSLEKVGPSAKVANGALDNVSSTLTNKLGPAAPLAQGALDKLGLTAGGLGNTVGIGMVAGVAAGGAALAKFALDGAQQFVSLAGEVRNFQRASGASAEEASRWVAVADDMQIESEKLSTSLFKLGKTLGADATALEKHGVQVARNAEGGVDLTETTLNVADAFSRTSDPAKRAELAAAAFGKAGKDLIPILEQGREGLQKFFEGAEGSHQILSQEDLDTARRYELAMDDLNDSVSGLQRNLGKDLVPVLANAAAGGAKLATEADHATEKIGGLSGIVKAGAHVFTPFWAGVMAVGEESNKAAAEQEKHATAAEHATEALEDERVATEQQAKALDGLLQATMAQFSSELAHERSLNGLEDAQAKVTEATKAHTEAVRQHGPTSAQAKASAEELSRAELGSRDAALQVASASVKMMEDQAKANGETWTATQRHEAFKGKLGEVRDSLAPGSPLRAALDGYIQRLEDMPTEQRTRIELEGATRAAEELRRVNTQIDNLRGAKLSVRVDNEVRGTPRASGGPVKAGQIYTWNERGKESVVFPADGHVLPHDVTERVERSTRRASGASSATAQPATAGVTLAPVINITTKVDAAPGVDLRLLADTVAEALNRNLNDAMAEVVARSLLRWTRRNGRFHAGTLEQPT